MDVGKLFGLSLFREILLVIVRWSAARKTIFSQFKLHKKYYQILTDFEMGTPSPPLPPVRHPQRYFTTKNAIHKQ